MASSDRSRSRDIRALGNITMELMQKYTKDDGAIGVDDLERWPSDCNAVGFLSMTTSATSVDELLKVNSTTFFDGDVLIQVASALAV